MNDQQQIVEEQGIGIGNFLWALLEQWRGMLVAGIIFALLLAGAKHIVNVRAAHYAESETGKEAEVAEGLYEGQQNVPRVLTYYQDWQNQKEYYENSPLMRIDATNEERYILRYYITSDHPEEKDFDTIEGCYRLIVYDEKFADSVSGIFDPNIQKKYIRELFLINPVNDKASDDALGRGFSVAVILPPREEGEYDYELIEKTITNYLNEKKKGLTKTFGDFDIKLMVSGYLALAYPDRGNTQTTNFNKIISAESKFQKEYSSLTASEKASVNKLVSEGNVREWLLKNRVPQKNEKAEAEEKTTSAKKATQFKFPKKFAALGFLIGLFIFAVLLFFRMIFSRKLRDEGEVGQVTGLRSFGGIYRYPYTSGWKKFLHSRKIYEMRHKTAAKPGAEASRITKKVAARAHHMEASNICMIVLGQSSDWIDSILQKQSGILEKEGISSSVAYAEDGIVSIDESIYGSMGTALLVTLSETTTPAMVAEILTRLKEYQIPVLGTEFMEVPAN